jgi:hypothetical protein
MFVEVCCHWSKKVLRYRNWKIRAVQVVKFFPRSGFITVTSSTQVGRVTPDLTGSVNYWIQLSPLCRQTSYRSGLIQMFCNSGSFHF